MKHLSDHWLLDSLVDGVLLLDPEWRIVGINRAAEAVLQVQRQDVQGRILGKEIAPQPAAWLDIYQEVQESRQPRRLPETHFAPPELAGRSFEGEVHPSPTGGIAVVFRDVTARKQAEEEMVRRNQELQAARDELQARNLELADATQAKDRFMAMMSHEMRTPLNAILGYVELLEMGLSGELNEMQRFQVERIRATGWQLLELVNDVLDLTRANVGEIDINPRPTNVAAVVEEVAVVIEPETEAKGLELRTEIAEECPLVHADLRRLRQILINLLSNAVKFTERGSITVRCQPGGDDFVHVSITDTGIGIAPDELPHIFSEFYQADSSLTREHGGSGLGLPIARRFARLMGGEVTAASEPGAGSTFTLTLPKASEDGAGERLDAEEAAGAAARARGAARRPSASARLEDDPPVVVVFGDSSEALDDLARKLQSSVRVVGTTRAEQVVPLARSAAATLVVLDVACGEGIGWKAVHALREDPALDEIAVLLLPCLPRHTDGTLAGALDLGTVAVMPKPLGLDRFAEVVERAAGAALGGEAEGASGPQPDGGEAARDVLVVDDDADARRIAARALEAAGAQVRVAPDGETGLAEMRRQRPDVAVLDLMMPVLDGFGVLAAMRADPALRDIPVVVLTAKDLSEDERRFLARSAERVLQKGTHRLSDVASLILRATASEVQG